MSNQGVSATALRSPQADVGIDKEALKRAFLDNLFYIQGKFPALATQRDYYMALAYVVRDSPAAALGQHGGRLHQRKARARSPISSAEFLLGPHLGNNLINLGIYDEVQRRRAASSASTSTSCCSRKKSRAWATAASGGWRRASSIRSRRSRFPTLGYGIRYEFGIFEQEIVDGWQVEKHRQVAARRQPVGHRAARVGGRGQVRRTHRAVRRRRGAGSACAGCPSKLVIGVPYDTPILGYQEPTPRTRCGCGAPRRRSRSISPCSIAATTTAR